MDNDNGGKNALLRTDHLNFMADYRNLSPAKIEAQSAVPRRQIARWLRTSESSINISSKHLLMLSEGLNVKPSFFREEHSEMSDREYLGYLKAALLWDGIYPNLPRFLRGVIKLESKATARLVEIYGLFESAHIIGESVWQEFPEYKRRIPPKRRSELERLWKRQKELGLID